MAAVEYHTAAEIMNQCGDDVIEFLLEHDGQLPTAPNGMPWSHLTSLHLAQEVELWAKTWQTMMMAIHY